MDQLNSTGWFAAPNSIFDFRELSCADKAVYLYLCRRAGPTGSSFPSLETIGRDCSISRSTATRCVHALISKGLVERQKRRRSRTNAVTSSSYRVCWRKEGDPRLTMSQPPPAHHEPLRTTTTPARAASTSSQKNFSLPADRAYASDRAKGILSPQGNLVRDDSDLPF